MAGLSMNASDATIISTTARSIRRLREPLAETQHRAARQADVTAQVVVTERATGKVLLDRDFTGETTIK